MRTFFAGGLTTLATLGAAGAAQAQDCDRQCLIDVADRYVAAVVAHDPSAAPLADDIRIVENAERIQPGEGLWESATSAPGDFVIHVPDTETRSVAYMAVMSYMAAPPTPQGMPMVDRAAWRAEQDKADQPVMIALRLTLDESGEIAEAEHLLAVLRSADTPTLQSPRPGLFTEIPEDQRLSRDEMRRIGATYYDALQDNDGTLAPFAADCSRHENGAVTSGGDYAASVDESTPHTARDCSGQLSSGQFKYITEIVNRRMFAADPVTGLVIGFSHFHHPMDNLPYEVVNTDGSTRMQDFDLDPFDALAAHIFKVGPDREIHEIEAIGIAVPFNIPTGWE